MTDNDNLSASASQQVVVVDPPKPPLAAFSFVCANLTCDFTDGSSDSDGSVVSWQWNFGDGTTSNARNPRHVFPAPGSYLITLTVTDDDALSAGTSRTTDVTSCFSATNSAHYGAGRATRTGFFFYTYYAAGSGTQLGSGSTTTALRGGNGLWNLVSSCPAPLPPLPAPPSVDSISVSVSNGVVTVSGTASNVNGNLSRVEVAIVAGGSETRVTATGTTTWSATLSGLAPGSYSAYAQAFDTTNLASAKQRERELHDPGPDRRSNASLRSTRRTTTRAARRGSGSSYTTTTRWARTTALGDRESDHFAAR